jgi:hypothetical protein
LGCVSRLSAIQSVSGRGLLPRVAGFSFCRNHPKRSSSPKHHSLTILKV